MTHEQMGKKKFRIDYNTFKKWFGALLTEPYIDKKVSACVAACALTDAIKTIDDHVKLIFPHEDIALLKAATNEKEKFLFGFLPHDDSVDDDDDSADDVSARIAYNEAMKGAYNEAMKGKKGSKKQVNMQPDLDRMVSELDTSGYEGLWSTKSDNFHNGITSKEAKEFLRQIRLLHVAAESKEPSWETANGVGRWVVDYFFDIVRKYKKNILSKVSRNDDRVANLLQHKMHATWRSLYAKHADELKAITESVIRKHYPNNPFMLDALCSDVRRQKKPTIKLTDRFSNKLTHLLKVLQKNVQRNNNVITMATTRLEANVLKRTIETRDPKQVNPSEIYLARRLHHAVFDDNRDAQEAFLKDAIGVHGFIIDPDTNGYDRAHVLKTLGVDNVNITKRDHEYLSPELKEKVRKEQKRLQRLKRDAKKNMRDDVNKMLWDEEAFVEWEKGEEARRQAEKAEEAKRKAEEFEKEKAETEGKSGEDLYKAYAQRAKREGRDHHAGHTKGEEKGDEEDKKDEKDLDINSPIKAPTEKGQFVAPKIETKFIW